MKSQNVLLTITKNNQKKLINAIKTAEICGFLHILIHQNTPKSSKSPGNPPFFIKLWGGTGWFL